MISVSFCNSRKGYGTHLISSSDIKDEKRLEINTVAFHPTDSLTKVFFEVQNDNLLYKRPDTSNSFYAKVRVSYKVYPEKNSKKIIDSSSFYINDFSKDEAVMPKSLNSEFNVKTEFGKSYYVELETVDINKKIRYKNELVINKMNRFNRQNFLIYSHGKIIFRNHFLKKGVVDIKCNDPKIEKQTSDLKKLLKQ